MTENFCTDLKAFFRKKGMTQVDIANAMGTSQPYVNAILNGRSAIGKEQARKMSTLFGIAYSYLLTGGEGEMFPCSTEQGKVFIASNNIYRDNASGNNNVTVNAETARAEDAQTGSPQFQLRPVVTKALSSKPNTDVYQVMKTDGAKMQQLVAFRQYADFDFYWQVRQDAMLPVYGQGDVLALVHLKPDTTIIQGAAMVVDTKDFGFLLRNIYDRGDYYECRCVNDDSKFETQNIKKDNVIRLYRVVYSVRLGD